jgi:hypothetical protein
MLADRMIAPFALLVAFGYGLVALFTGQWLVALIYLSWWLVSRLVKMIPHLVRRPRDIVILPAFVAMNFGMAFLKIHALITIHEHRWLTRPVEVVDGKVVRVEPGASRSDHPPLRTRLAGTAIAVALFTSVQLLLLGFGGAGYLPRVDTTAPEVAADVPAVVPVGSSAPLMVAVEGERNLASVTYTWTLDGVVIGAAPAIGLPADLTPGEYRWAVHVRDASGNTTSMDGTLLVTPTEVAR